MNNNKSFIIIISVFFLLAGCSFDSKTGIWSGEQNEKKINKKDENKILNVEKIYSSEQFIPEEMHAIKNITLSAPKKNSSWFTSNLNSQNFKGHLYLSGVENNFLKKKIGKNKFSITKVMSSPIMNENAIILADDTGTIFNINNAGKIIWKKNIYKKKYKKIYKNISTTIFNNQIFVSDNIGFIYSLDINSGKIIWIKNHGIPLKSKIKIFNEKIFLVNQDNRIICLDSKTGTKVWDVRTISSFIKAQNFLALAISKNAELFTINSSGDLVKLSTINGQVFWSLNVTPSLFAHDKDFFESSDIVVSGEDIVFSTTSSLFSYNLNNRFMNWKIDMNSTNTPIIDGNNLFIVSSNGFFVNLDKTSGKIIWSINILKILKQKKRNTNITGFIMASNKIYATTRNGFLIIASAVNGKTESFKKIGNQIITDPIISNGSLYILTKESKLFGFN